MQRKPRTALHKLLAIYPYLCVRCSTRQTRFRLTLGTIFKFSLLAALVGAVVYFSVNPISFRRVDDGSQNSAEALSRARTAAGGLSAFEQMMIKRPRTTMDNATILRLWRANVSPNVIVQMIRTANADYDVSANAIIELKQAGVDQIIILAMIDASYNTR
jgi:hypothetical protein